MDKVGMVKSFIEAARDGDMAELERGISLGLASEVDRNGCSALMEAAREGLPEVVERLLQAPGCNPKASDCWGGTALMWSAKTPSECHARCAAILAPVSDIHATDKGGATALMWAASSGSVEQALMLLAGGREDLLIRDLGGLTPLAAACQNSEDGGLEMIELLLPGSDLKSVDGNGRTPLMIAAAQISAGAVELLAAAGSDRSAVDFNGRNALMHAVGGVEALQKARFLAGGCDPEAVDNDGNTALMLTCKTWRSHGEIEWGPSEVEGPDELAVFLRGICNPLAINKEGRDALAIAAKNGPGGCILALASAGGAGRANKAGKTPLMELGARGMRMLGRGSENVEGLMVACALALAEHCDVSEKNASGRTAADNAWLHDNEAMARALEAVELARAERAALAEASLAPKNKKRGPKRSL